MTLPAALLGIVISSLYGALFHLWRGGGLGRIVLYQALAWAGFWLGHLAASLLDLRFLEVGPLNLGLATIGSLLFLLAGHWLSLVEISRE